MSSATVCWLAIFSLLFGSVSASTPPLVDQTPPITSWACRPVTDEKAPLARSRPRDPGGGAFRLSLGLVGRNPLGFEGQLAPSVEDLAYRSPKRS